MMIEISGHEIDVVKDTISHEDLGFYGDHDHAEETRIAVDWISADEDERLDPALALIKPKFVKDKEWAAIGRIAQAAAVANETADQTWLVESGWAAPAPVVAEERTVISNFGDTDPWTSFGMQREEQVAAAAHVRAVGEAALVNVRRETRQ